MGLVATAEGGGDFTPAPAGTFVARCVQLVDLGTQYSEFYKKAKYKVMLGWELPTEINDEDDGKPFLVWKRYTMSLNEKAILCQHLEAWRGRKFTEAELAAFNLRNILGKPCMITTQHDDSSGKRTYCNVVSVTAMPKGMDCPPQVHPTILFDIGEWDDAVFETFGDNLKKTIMESPEAKARSAPKPPPAGRTTPDHSPIDESQIPF